MSWHRNPLLITKLREHRLGAHGELGSRGQVAQRERQRERLEKRHTRSPSSLEKPNLLRVKRASARSDSGDTHVGSLVWAWGKGWGAALCWGGRAACVVGMVLGGLTQTVLVAASLERQGLTCPGEIWEGFLEEAKTSFKTWLSFAFLSALTGSHFCSSSPLKGKKIRGA